MTDHPLTGGCQCGRVRYILEEMPTSPSICHCRMCQKAVAGPFAVFTGLPRTALRWTRGELTTVRSSSTTERGHCAACGTPLTCDSVDGDRINVTIYSLDHPDAIKAPDRQIGTESRATWLDNLNEFPGMTTEADCGPEFIATCQNYQHPDHDTPDSWTPHCEERKS